MAEFKQVVADLTLENMAMKGLITKKLTPPRKREAVYYLVGEEKLPITRACGYLGLSRAAYYRKPI